MAQTEQRERTSRRRGVFLVVVLTTLLLLFGVPWWALVFSGPQWPAPVVTVGTVVFVGAAVAFPWLMYLGHGRGRDWAARIGDTTLGVVWVLFAWTVLGTIPRIVLAAAGVDNPQRARIVALAVLAVVVILVIYGVTEAMRVPRVKPVEVHIPRLGPGLDGTRVVVLADTHLGPIDRSRWSAVMATKINELDPDIVCHAGDIADGTVDKRRVQAAPLGTIRARLARVYVTGNHEYFGEAQSWLDHMAELGWEPLHNRHIVVERGGDRLVLAGIDDATARSSGQSGHGADLTDALSGACGAIIEHFAGAEGRGDGDSAGADPEVPVLLVAHQPRQVAQAASAGIDLQVSGHTHGGQIWPFHYLVRVDQPSVRGLTRHGQRTQLYTSRGAGFWGPPLRIFAPSEISLLTLRASLR